MVDTVRVVLAVHIVLVAEQVERTAWVESMEVQTARVVLVVLMARTVLLAARVASVVLEILVAQLPAHSVELALAFAAWMHHRVLIVGQIG
jgi:hypothetical protein